MSMKHPLLLSLILLVCSLSQAQVFPDNFNLVPNGGFELHDGNYYDLNYHPSFDYNIYDTSFENSSLCWITANKGWLYHWTNSDNRAAPRTGFKAISAGVVADFRPSDSTWLDSLTSSQGIHFYPQTKLLQPLEAGKKYHLTFYVGARKGISEIDWNRIVIKNIGAYFSTEKITSPGAVTRLPVTPQLNFTEWDLPLNDTFMYAKLQGIYIATGGEQYLTFGNFDYFANYKLLYLNPGQNQNVHNYPLAIDDISLYADTTQPLISLDGFSLGPDVAICPGESVSIGGNPYFFHYGWNTGDTTRFITVRDTGTYWCAVDFGCNVYTDTIRVYYPSMEFSIRDTMLCDNKPIVFSAPPPPLQHIWSNGSTADEFVITHSGNYWIKVMSNCDTQLHYFTVTDPADAFAKPDLGPDAANCTSYDTWAPVTLTVDDEFPLSEISWSNGAKGVRSITVSEPGLYWVHVDNECYHFGDSIRLLGCPPKAVDSVWLPTAFTPNGDGINDVFKVPFAKAQIFSFELKIYDRWGKAVAVIRDKDTGWDGAGYPMGTYFYRLRYKDALGREHFQKGDVTLIR